MADKIYLATLDEVMTVANAVSEQNATLANAYALANNAATKSELEEAVTAVVANSGSASYSVVSEVPSADEAESNVLYLVLNGETGYYDTYALMDGEMLLISSTEIDLSDYVTNSALNSAIANMVTHAANTAVGSATQPVYVAENGAASASESTVGSAAYPVYLANGVITNTAVNIAASYVKANSAYTLANAANAAAANAYAAANNATAAAGALVNNAVTHAANTAVGSMTQTIYVAANGAATASNAAVGSTNYPVYMSNGTIANTGVNIAASYAKANNAYTLANTANTTATSAYAAANNAVTHAANTAVGSATQPVYVAANGEATAVTGSAGNGTKLSYTLNGIATNSTSTVGEYNRPVYLSNGVVTVAVANNSTAIGYGATSASYATAYGNNATANGGSSVAVGRSALASGSAATALGQGASASGTSATALGHVAKATYYYATALGYYATASANYSSALGYYAVCANANGIQLGNASTLSTLTCRVELTVTSDIRDKTDIEELDSATEFLNSIHAIRYVLNEREKYIDTENLTEEDKKNLAKYGMCEYDTEAHAAGEKKGSRIRTGVSAQEVQEALESIYGDSGYANLVNDNLYDFDADEIPEGVESRLAVNYSGFIPFLIKAVQELSARIDALEGNG